MGSFSALGWKVPEQGLQGGCVISREFLSSCSVIVQVANEIIICVQDGYLCAFDQGNQHACHERVRLENLEAEVYVGDGRTGRPLFIPIQLSNGVLGAALSDGVVKACLEQTWGFTYELDPAANMITVTRVPAFLCHASPSPSFFLEEFMAALAKDIAGHSAILPHGLSRMRPQAVHDLLASRACRGAIMFGTALSRQQAKGIISQLQTTCLPYQCAHGRPSVVPLTKLAPRRPSLSVSEPKRFALSVGQGPNSLKRLKRPQDIVEPNT